MIILNDCVAITADTNQYILGVPNSRVNNRQPKLKNPHYYNSIGAALRAAVAFSMRQDVAEDKITTLEQFITQQRQLMDVFTARIEAAGLNLQ